MSSPRDQFQQEWHIHRAAATDLAKQYRNVAWLRVTVFVVGLGLVLYFANERQATYLSASLLAFGGLFFVLIKWHQKIGYLRDWHQYRAQLAEAELHRLNGHWELLEQADFVPDPHHPYSLDMDVFGQVSLFQLLNRTATVLGENRLAEWLLGQLPDTPLAERQAVVRELAWQFDRLQDFRAKGSFHEFSPDDMAKLRRWMQGAAYFSKNKLYQILSYLLPVATLAGAIGYFLFDLPSYVLSLPLMANLIVLGSTFARVKTLADEALVSAKALGTWRDLLAMIEEGQPEAPLLREGQQRLRQGEIRASVAIAQLGRLLENLEARQNVFFYAFVNLPLLWELFWAIRLEQWREQHRPDIELWFGVLADFDAWQSLAGFSYAHPEYIYPTLSENSYNLQMEAGGHPLIASGKRITNDFSFGGQGTVWMITGSNMSGKSTFLRTLGVNIVLAYTGAPVCARRMELGDFQLFSSMRIQDSLADETSAFYAELKRIRQLLDHLQQGKPVFYLLDEVLRGTNSQDRHTGMKAILGKLMKAPCFGLISTHDLALAQLADAFPEIRNFSFNSTLVDDQLVFHYRLEPGICHSFSASKLMERLGIIEEM